MISNSIAKSLMILGTSSGVGKTNIGLAFCRLLSNENVKVAPFKALNISLNSYVTQENLEMSMGQVKQAIACRQNPTISMNPVLLKPTLDHPHFILQGMLWKEGMKLPSTERTEIIRNRILKSYEQLSKTMDCIIVEGSGSPVELNLKDRDLSNFWLAEKIDAKCILVADINRGGVFASLIGTFSLMSAQEKARILGFIINKFQGDIDSFSDGVKILEEKTGKPCLGVIPFFSDLNFQEEDDLLFENKKNHPEDNKKIKIGILRYPNISNSSDFDPFLVESQLEIDYVSHSRDWKGYDLLILPGSKSTIQDLKWLYDNNLHRSIYHHYQSGGKILGICGGMQMLGHKIFDPHYTDNSSIKEINGLGLLNISTTMLQEKVLKRVKASAVNSEIFNGTLQGYEMHMGKTIPEKGYTPLFKILNDSDKGKIEGAISQDQRVWGTYLHGLFETDAFRQRFFEIIHPERSQTVNYDTHIQNSIAQWANHVFKHLNKNFHGLLKKNYGYTFYERSLYKEKPSQ